MTTQPFPRSWASDRPRAARDALIMKNGYNVTGADKAALWIFAIAVVVRAVMQFAPHDPGGMIDYAWVTNFAAIAAGWLSIRSRVGDNAKTVERVQIQTSGELERRLEKVVRRVLTGVTKG
jgi:hypothetical protein